MQHLSQLENAQQQFKTELDKKNDQIDRLTQKILILENDVRMLQKGNTTSQKPVMPLKPSRDPEKLYQYARNLLLEQDFAKALTLFQTFIDKYPQDELADNAMYWMGECYYSMGSFEKAIDTFQELVTRYPKGIKVPDALLKTGYAYLSLKDNNRAHHFLKLVITRYPFSEAADKAQNKLDTFN